MRTNRWFLCGVIVTLIATAVTAVHAAEAVKPLSLSESIDLALKRSVLIHAVREGVKGAEAQRKEAFTGFLPKFSTSYSYNRLNEEPTFNFPGAPSGIPASTIKTGTKENYAWTIEVRQPLFAGGGILANYEASRIGAEIVRLEETATVQDLVQEVKIAYFNILKAGRIDAVARQSVERLTAHRDTAQGFYDVGIIPRNDLLYAEVELANGRQFLVRAENSLEMAKSKFNTLLRREINAPVEIEDTLNDRPFAKPLAGCIAAGKPAGDPVNRAPPGAGQEPGQTGPKRVLPERRAGRELRQVRRHAGRRRKPLPGPGELVRHGGGQLEFLGVGKDQKPCGCGS